MSERSPYHFFLCMALVFALSACHGKEAVKRPLFGPDNRIEVIHGNAAVCEVGSAVFAVFSRKDLKQDLEGVWHLANSKSLSDTDWCSGVRFSVQPASARCTAFLVAPDLVSTAGHCLGQPSASTAVGIDCEKALFVLDFKLSITRQAVATFSSHQVFGCKEVIAGNDSRIGPDWTIVRLDRAPERKPLAVYSGEHLPDSSLLHVVGHPLGLPMKAADAGRVIGYTNGRYRTTLDTFRGNSGSPVFTLVNGRPVVIGMMTGGGYDKQKNELLDCDVVRVCSSKNDCRGQLATDTKYLLEWASRAIHDFSVAPSDGLAANCAWCQEPLRSRHWQCPLSVTLE